MIARQVKLTFQSERVPEFLELFGSVENNIKKIPGCLKLDLYQDINNHHIFFTFSIWNSEADLELYRNSPLFQSIWNKTKVFFSAKAEAISLVKISFNP